MLTSSKRSRPHRKRGLRVSPTPSVRAPTVTQEASMAKSRPSVQKRRKEAAKLERAQVKAARKAAREAARERGEVEGLNLDGLGLEGLGFDGRAIDEDEDASAPTPEPAPAPAPDSAPEST